ncbi:MAG: hypothetical protein NC254_06395 [bacterium]|nr:hypothetical protein [bacterium]
MQKKLLAITACMIAALAAVGIFITIRQSGQRRRIEQILRNEDGQEQAAHGQNTGNQVSEGSSAGGQSEGNPPAAGQDAVQVVSLETVRREAETLIAAGRNGVYRNLEFQEIVPLIPAGDRIYRIRVSTPASKKPMTEKDLQQVVDMMQAFFEEPVDETKIEAIPYYGSSVDTILVSELRGELQNQNEAYTGTDYVFLYRDHWEEGKRAQIISSAAISLMIDNIDVEEPYPVELPEPICYYPGAVDGSLEDVYETAGGELSVKEAIEQTEAYFNEGCPVADTLPDGMTYRVSRVFISGMSDGTYAFEVELRRAYRGVLFQGDARSQAHGQDHAAERMYDLTHAVLGGENRIIDFGGISLNDQVEEIEEITEIVSLEKAAEYISQENWRPYCLYRSGD